MGDSLPSVPSQTAGGATVQSEYMGRTMKCYPVHETEMESLSTMNTEATVFFSSMSACIALAAGIVTNAIFAERSTEMSKFATLIGAPFLGGLAILFGCLGVYTAYRRSALWGRIKQEAVTLKATA